MGKNFIIYKDGQWMEADKDFLESLTPGKTDRYGVFETMRAYEHRIFAYDAHMDRLERGLKRYGYSGKIERAKVKRNILRLFELNCLKNVRARVAYVLDGKKARIEIVCLPIKRIPDSFYQQGFNVRVASVIKKKTKFSHVKSLQYRFFLTEYQKAVEHGYHEALFLDENQHIVEGTRTNFFCFQRGGLYTPPVASGCLNGITRKIVLTLARQAGIKVRTENIPLKDLRNCQEAFVTNSILEIMPISLVSPVKRVKPLAKIRTLTLLHEYRKFVKKTLNR